MYNKIQLKRTIPNIIPSKRKIVGFVWKITDIGLDNNQDGVIEQSFLESSYRNLELTFYKNQTGIILQKEESMEILTFSFDWKIHQENSSVIIWSDHPLFCIRTKWKVHEVRYDKFQLSYQIKLSDQTITVMMEMKSNKIKRRRHAMEFIELVLLAFFYI